MTSGLANRHRRFGMAWDVPYGSLFLELDPLSGFFLIPVFVLCALAAIYGADYLEAYRGRKALAPPWFFFNLLVASMVVVILARNGVLFLMAWEMMALSSFFLVTFEDEKREYSASRMDISCRQSYRHCISAGAVYSPRKSTRVSGLRSVLGVGGRRTSVRARAGRIWNQGGLYPAARAGFPKRTLPRRVTCPP